MQKQNIFIASDHGGFATKQKLVEWLKKKKISFHDISPKLIPDDDFPCYAKAVAEKVNSKKGAKGILICGTGMGMTIAANKCKGIRAVTPYDAYTAKMSRTDNDANVLGLRGRNFPFQKITQIVQIWLSTPASKKAQYKRRILQIEKMEQ